MAVDLRREAPFMDYLEHLRVKGLPGVRIRPFAGGQDYPAMTALMNALEKHEGVAPMWDETLLRLADRAIPDFNPPRDRVILEYENVMIGAGRVSTGEEPDGSRIYVHSCNLLPAWRGKGIEPVVMEHNERQLRAMSARYPGDKGRLMRAGHIPDTNPEAKAALIERGYEPIRYGYHMERPDLQNIPEVKLPAGIGARPVKEGEERAIWDANLEAFRDHWGYQEPPANAFDLWRQNPNWDRGLSRVAWAGSEVAGMVLIYVPRVSNASSGRRIAETEQICVRRPWRRKGVATALIAQCLVALREAGFVEAALGVDTQNTSGALRIYERMGYQVRQRYTMFQKAMD